MAPAPAADAASSMKEQQSTSGQEASNSTAIQDQQSSQSAAGPVSSIGHPPAPESLPLQPGHPPVLDPASVPAAPVTQLAHQFPAPSPPPSAFPAPPPPPPGAGVFMPNQTLSFATIDDALAASPYLSSLRSLLHAFPTQCDIYSSVTNCTLFAATDASWAALSSYLGKTVDQLATSPVMTPLLYYQYIPKVSLNISDLQNGVAYQTSLYDQQLTVNKQPAGFGGTSVFISPSGSPDALVILGDIVAAHSRLHVIRGPLIPTNLVGPLTGNPPPRIPVYVTQGP
ncbi:hypothetical protein COCSUDRAFT_62353 [Coccomyxa subellipsoidea C-169]|uniref:FAS1 domain-containing protein n=1 Tax=Coccomyxa subellipsoidea (strain C-169) TaxID=574566 RepID=I0Z2S8_COCSC|nr:hypothetical protein COCSUDRAFT_62353 [Coccomyxa subellipsoidea C-169]EIE24947.1 hypothetical protein COCSUDRAFT_62353 [Coccomyxa subellipsoidea C-169]|eukprot:XP_005649491.1 hypothetical protein COCSUDRAFT_62353 [Coccomyxa subellipsoidea C-169]